MNNTTVTQDSLQAMNDKEFMDHLRAFPWPYQWQDHGAFHYAQLRLSHMQGNIYLKTGNISAFRTRPLMKNFVPI